MITLKNVSKFYYKKGVIASGFSRVNLEFNIGEFVAITGESGSGKSTLLNVISGLDSYEEGEMYINGEETSHYTEQDFENYRRTYIGNIFQSFNLINSYTVYQNIELILLLNGEKKKDIKEKVIELIKKVDLYKFRNTKVSKLSGGQKQRVAIARALAKDTPIIIADEPTGNLDTKSSESVIKLLSQIAEEKLVIIVTHNYEQVEKYVTRKITMHDGKILEDKKIKETETKPVKIHEKFKNITTGNKIRLGVRNTFNIIPKFLLVLCVYLFITVAILSEYASFQKEETLSKESGINYIFSNMSTNRIIIKKQDGSSYQEEEFSKIQNIENVDYIVKNDCLLDMELGLTNDMDYMYATVSEKPVTEVDLGRLPESDYEIVMEGSKDDYYIGDRAEDILNKEFRIEDYNTEETKEEYKLKVVGVKYVEEENMYRTNKMHVQEKVLNDLKRNVNQKYSTTKTMFMNKNYENKIVPNDNVPVGKVYVPEEFEEINQNCIGKNLEISVENIYYKDTLNVSIDKIYKKTTIEKMLGIKDFEKNNGTIFINTTDYNNLFNKNTYQASVFAKDSRDVEEICKNLQEMGMQTLAIKDTLVQDGTLQVLRIFKTAVTVVLVITLFFISYFVIKIILKSRNVYFSTIRMIGASKGVSTDLLIIELLTVSNIAYFSFIGLILLVKNNIIASKFLNNLITYLELKDFAILYLVIITMSILISKKFAKSIFKKSAMKAFREEV